MSGTDPFGRFRPCYDRRNGALPHRRVVRLPEAAAMFQARRCSTASHSREVEPLTGQEGGQQGERVVGSLFDQEVTRIDGFAPDVGSEGTPDVERLIERTDDAA